MTELPPRSPGGFKQDFRIGDAVRTPLGTGEIIGIKFPEKPEGSMYCTVKHRDFCDHDGDTFDLDVLSLNHLPEHPK